MRERRLNSTIGIVTLGITPAYAGKTVSLRLLFGLVGDHPRVCGKDIPFIALSAKNWGSPPRMRERPSSVYFFCTSVGITPAYAGKTAILSALVLKR